VRAQLLAHAVCAVEAAVLVVDAGSMSANSSLERG
jgi:hypothetical protein